MVFSTRIFRNLDLRVEWVLRLYSVGFEDFEGQGPWARLCCRRYLTPYFGYITLPNVDWAAQFLAQRKSQKKYTKRKDRNR